MEARKILEDDGLQVYSTSYYDQLRGLNYAGFAELYLAEKYNDEKLVNEANLERYKSLVAIDSKFGTTMSEQLLNCVRWTLRMDLIQV